LGLPLFIDRKKADSFIDLKKQILAKVTGWKTRILSQAARTTLIKSVANAIPSYTMSPFPLPKHFCYDIDMMLQKFWWGFPQDKHNLSLLSWENICKPKALGGLGICSIEFLNNSLLARLGWKLLYEESLLWVEALSGKYLSNGISFLVVDVKPQSSWTWKGLLKNRKLLLKGACWSISKGDFIDVWKSPWIPSMPCFKPRSKENLLVFPAYSVADLILPEERLWNVDLLHDLFDPLTIQNILQILLPCISTEEKWSWIPSPSGIFTVKSAREVSLTPSTRVHPFTSVVWQAL
jgi:hypothetical protein